jgi:serine protease AprX
VAPKVNLLSVKVSDDRGAGTTRSVVMGLQWILEHKAQYNIRIVNLSLNSKVPESYHVSPLNAALEVLWFNGIVVVVSAGNSGTAGYLYPPANDPFVITVGATDDRGTPDLTDDVLAHFSAYGTTESGFAKPDIVAPGTNLVSLSAGRDANLSVMHSDHRVDGSPLYFRMSGTSMSAAVATGAIALLLQREPNLNPDQVKFRLKATARQMAGPGFGAGHLDIYAAINTPTTERANIGTPISHFITGADDQTVWDSVNWDSVNWDSVNWDSVNWDSVNWDSVNWDSVNWDN